MLKVYILGFIVGVFLLIVAGVGGYQAKRNEVEQAKKDVEQAKYKAELVDATPADSFVLTDQQRIHSNLHTYYRQVRGDKTISGLTELATNYSKIIETRIHVGLGPVLEPETPEHYFGELSQASQAVIQGKVRDRVSYITEDDGFILTDYQIVVTEVLKNNEVRPIDPGTIITVTHPGGKVLLSGIIIKAVDDSFEPLPASSELVLFLQYIPETATYKATRNTGSFEVTDQTFKPLTKSTFPPGVLRGKDSFMQTVRAMSKN